MFTVLVHGKIYGLMPWLIHISFFVDVSYDLYVCKQLGCLGILLCFLVRLKQFPVLLSLPLESISHSPKACSWLGESGRLKYNLFDEAMLLKEWFLKCGSYFPGRCRGLHKGATACFLYCIPLSFGLGKKKKKVFMAWNWGNPEVWEIR